MTYSVNLRVHLDWRILCISFVYGVLKEKCGSKLTSLSNKGSMKHFSLFWAFMGIFSGIIAREKQ